MPRYSDEQHAELRNSYLAAARTLAMQQGWSAVSVRNIAAVIGSSASPIHREGILSIKRRLVSGAFGELKEALMTFMDTTPPLPRKELHPLILRHLRAYPGEARLMAQVAAQVGLTGSAEADAISEHFQAELDQTVRQVTGFYRKIDPVAALTNCQHWAQDLVRWYIAACVTLVTGPGFTEGWLLTIAGRLDTEA